MSTSRKKPITNDELEIGMHFELEKAAELREQIGVVLADIETTLDHWDSYKKSAHFNDITFEKFVYSVAELEDMAQPGVAIINKGGKKTTTYAQSHLSNLNFHNSRSRPSSVINLKKLQDSSSASMSSSEALKLKIRRKNTSSVSKPQILTKEEIISRVRAFQATQDAYDDSSTLQGDE